MIDGPRDAVSGYKTYGKRRSLRLRGFDYRTPRPYHLTWGTVHRKAVLNNRGLVVSLIENLEAEANDAGMLVYAYCFMPEHVHLLLSPEGKSPEGKSPEGKSPEGMSSAGVPSERGKDVVQFVQAYKSKTTRLFWRMGNRGKLWQHGFYDHILRQEENIKQVARNIMDNHVRRGLVDGFLEYPFRDP